MSKIKAGRTKMLKIQASTLKIHPKAQRAIIRNHLREIEKNLDPDAIGTLTAVDYKIHGKQGPWVIDGQHRLMALMNQELGDVFVKVLIHTNVTNDARAAELFLKLNKRAAVSPYDKYLNQLVSKDPIAIGVDRIVREHDLSVAKRSSDNKVCCVSALKKLYQVDGGEALSDTLEVCIMAWGAKAAALEGSLITGVGLVLSKHNGTIDKDALKKKLSKYSGGPSAMVGDAKGITRHDKTSMGRCVAKLVIDTYNKGRSKGRIEYV